MTYCTCPVPGDPPGATDAPSGGDPKADQIRETRTAIQNLEVLLERLEAEGEPSRYLRDLVLTNLRLETDHLDALLRTRPDDRQSPSAPA